MIKFKIKIFYAWQMTTATRFNKDLISTAISHAIKKLNGNGIFKNVEFVLTQDTKGFPGSPNINESIDSQVAEADIFICDLTNCSGKANDNVLIEYGQAKQAHCLSSIIGVCNTFYGNPEEYLGFDINHNRFPISYFCNSDEDIEEVQKKLSVNLEQAIREIGVSVLENQDWKYRPFFTLTTLKKNFQQYTGQFFTTEKIDEIKHVIYENSTQDGNIRFIGLSGLGKTKITISALEHDELCWGARYCDCNKEEASNIKAAVDSMCQNRDSFYLVLDNCSQELAKIINYILKKNGIQMPVLSIFNDRAETTDAEFNILYLDTNDTETIVRNIIIQRISKDPAAIERLSAFASNNPQMAVLLANAFIKTPNDNLAILSNSEFLDRLLITSSHSDERIVLQSFSLFDFIGVENENKEQLKFLATNENITSLNGTQQTKINLFTSTYKKFLKRQIFEKNGSYAGIRPKPLAWYLLGEWFSNIDSERMLDVINDIQSFEDHSDIMLEAMCHQLAFMNTCQEAVEMLNNICRVHGPFANADVVYTKMGSRLLRAFSEVNPPAVSGCLHKIISNTPTEVLNCFIECRRNLVITAQKLAFDSRTFNEGAEILFYLSLAENERWANNATNSFTGLFSVHLPSTSVNLLERVNFLSSLRNKNNYHTLFIKAIQSALTVDAGFYVGGAEQQGTKHLSNYKADNEEISKYLEQCLSFLLEEINLDIKNADIVFYNSIRSLCRCGFCDLVIDYISRFLDTKKINNDNLLIRLQELMQYDSYFLTSKQKETIKKIEDALKSDDFISSLKYIERDLRNNNLNLDYYKLRELSVEKLSPIIEKFLENHTQWEGYLAEIYKLDSLYISEIGSILAKKLTNDIDASKFFVDISIRIFEELEKYDVQIFLKFIKENSPAIFEYAVLKIKPHTKIHKILFQLYGIRNVSPEDIEILFSCVDTNNSELSLFDSYWQLFNFTDYSDSKLALFFEKLAHYNKSLPIIMSLSETLFMFRRDPFPNTLEFLVQYLCQILREANHEMDKINNLFLLGEPYGKPTDFPNEYISSIYSVIEKLLKNGKQPELAFLINQYLLSRLVTDYSAGNNGYFENLFEVLLERYFDSIWGDMGAAIVSKERKIFQFMSLKTLLGYRDFPYGRSESLINFNENKETISKWCAQNPEIAPKRVAELLKPYDNNDGDIRLTKSSQWLLENYGDDKGVFDALFIACGTYFVQGSMIPKLEEHKRFAEVLIDNKNANVSQWGKQKVKEFEQAIINQRNKEAEEKFLYQ